MDPELIEYLDRRFEESRSALDDLRQETASGFDGLEEGLRQVHVLVEDQSTSIQTVAEGVASNHERITRLRAEMKEEFDDLRSVLHRRSVH